MADKITPKSDLRSTYKNNNYSNYHLIPPDHLEQRSQFALMGVFFVPCSESIDSYNIRIPCLAYPRTFRPFTTLSSLVTASPEGVQIIMLPNKEEGTRVPG